MIFDNNVTLLKAKVSESAISVVLLDSMILPLNLHLACADDAGAQAEAVLLSNRATASLQLKLYAQAGADAQRAAELWEGWSKP